MHQFEPSLTMACPFCLYHPATHTAQLLKLDMTNYRPPEMRETLSTVPNEIALGKVISPKREFVLWFGVRNL